MSSPEKLHFESYQLLDDFWWFGIRYLLISVTFLGCKPALVCIPVDCDRQCDS